MIGTIEQMLQDMKQKTPKMSPELARELLSKYDGSHSEIYPLIKEEIELYHYPSQDLPWPECFIFFENDYLKYYLDIVGRKIPCNTVLDIGCFSKKKNIYRSKRAISDGTTVNQKSRYQQSGHDVDVGIFIK